MMINQIKSSFTKTAIKILDKTLLSVGKSVIYSAIFLGLMWDKFLRRNHD